MKKAFIAFAIMVIAAGSYAFTHAETKQKPTNSMEIWFYTGSSSDEEELFNAANYDQTTSSPCTEIVGIPCQIHFDPQVYSSLQDYLDAVENNQDVLNVDSRKP